MDRPDPPAPEGPEFRPSMPGGEALDAGPGPAPAAPMPRGAAARAMLLAAMAVVSGFILLRAPVLWREWTALRGEWERDRLSQPIGFVNISPNPSFARPPKEWAMVQDERLLLWSGWTPGVGHNWFKVGLRDLEPDRYGPPMGRDVVRAIDHPMVEQGGGTIWGRMQPDSMVIELRHRGAVTAYPLLLLQKVEVVNDALKSLPLLVVFSPFVPPERAVHVFDPIYEGRRLTMGLSGYFEKPGMQPVLYDRQTESLWVVRGRRLDCVAGACKGASLRSVAETSSELWGDWASANPRGRLVIGAHRDGEPKGVGPL